jgi:hypothetical protein
MSYKEKIPTEGVKLSIQQLKEKKKLNNLIMMKEQKKFDHSTIKSFCDERC